MTKRKGDDAYMVVEGVISEANKLGFEVANEQSSGFGSEYVTIRDPESNREWKMRFSDHERQLSSITKHKAPNFEQVGNLNLEAAVSWLRKKRETLNSPPKFDQKKYEEELQSKAQSEVKKYEQTVRDLEANRDKRIAQGNDQKAANIQSQIDQIKNSIGYKSALNQVDQFRFIPSDIRNPRHSVKGDNKGININDECQDFTGQILRGEKTIETRPSRSLDSRIGKRTGIIRTGAGKATLVGYAIIGKPVVYDSVAKFRRDQSKHRVAPGSIHDIKGGLKYGYPLMQVEAVTPRIITSRGNVIRKLNPLSYPPQDITLSHDPTPANIDIAAEKALWETAAFKKWFGDSKVRDLAKRPMVVYHGTCSAGFTKFDPTKTQEMGFHFGTPSQAKDFLKGCGTFRGRSAGVYPVYLSIQNPLFTPDAFSEDPVYFIEWLEDTNHIHNWFPDESDSYYRSLGKLRDQLAESRMLPGREGYDVRKPLYKAIWGLLRKVVMRKGYDGIRYKNENEGNTFDASNIAWIAFSPAQVKSATENRGTFNRRDPDLRNPRRSMIRSKLSRIIEPGDRVLDYDRAQGEDLYRLWDLIHTDMPLTKEALVEIEGMLDDDGVLVIQSGEEPAGLRDHFRRVVKYQGMLLVQGPMNPEEARINTEKLRRDLE